MKNWLKNKLRAWLFPEEIQAKKVSGFELEVRINGGVQVWTASAVAGLGLLCTDSYGTSQRLIRSDEAKSRERFIELFKDLGGVVPKWGDGTDFEFP